MPQIQIKDALGNVQTAAKVTNTGRTSHTDSMPVTLSNEDFAQLQSIDTKTPALVAGTIPTTDSKGGTRVYDFDNNSRVVVTSTSTTATPLPPLYDSREAMFHAKERTFVRLGTSGVAPATDGDKQLILEAGERFHMRIPAGVTHYRAITETTDGVATITAVVS